MFIYDNPISCLQYDCQQGYNCCCPSQNWQQLWHIAPAAGGNLATPQQPVDVARKAATGWQHATSQFLICTVNVKEGKITKFSLKQIQIKLPFLEVNFE